MLKLKYITYALVSCFVLSSPALAQKKNGQSFMPSRFDQYPDQLLADLVAYLKGL